MAGNKHRVCPVLNKAPCHKDVWKVEVLLHTFLTSAINRTVKTALHRPYPTGQEVGWPPELMWLYGGGNTTNKTGDWTILGAHPVN
jgi:hypothetical protein